MRHESTTCIRAVEPHDFPTLALLRRDKEVQHLLLGYPPETPPDDAAVWAWIKRKSEEGCFFAVTSALGGATIGFVQLHDIHRVGRRASFGVAIIDVARGMGHAGAAVREVIAFGKAKWMLEKVLCEVRADNAPSLRMCAKLGFDRVGVMQSHYRGHDVVLLEKFV